MQEVKVIPEGYMADSKGRFVPENLVKETEKLEDQMVRKCMEYADELSGQIARFKGHTFDDVSAFMDLLSAEYGLTKGGKKGNVTFTTFDGCQKVQVAVQDHIDFGPQLQVAKGLIDECINDWSEGAHEAIRALVNHAFNVDKTGQVNRAALFQLRRFEIDDERWKQAVQAINDSIRTIGSKTYIRFYRRENPQDKWQAVTIDLAAVR
jgi:hypothetical protein